MSCHEMFKLPGRMYELNLKLEVISLAALLDIRVRLSEFFENS